MQPAAQLFAFERTISFHRSREHVYEQWCRNGLWPAFVRPLSSADGNILLMHRIPGEMVQWYTMDGATTPTASEAWFHETDDGHSTELQIIVAWLGSENDHTDSFTDGVVGEFTERHALNPDRLSGMLSRAVDHFQQIMEQDLATTQGAYRS